MKFQQRVARKLGRKCSVAVVMIHLLSQDAEARRIYAAGMDPDLFFGAALVVSNPLSQAIGSFFIGLPKPSVPTRLIDSVESGVAWLQNIRGASSHESQN